MTVESDFTAQPPVVVEPKLYSPEAIAALNVHIARTRTSIMSSAERSSRDELIVLRDIHTAIDQLALSELAVVTRLLRVSEWLKWMGFFVLGLAIPACYAVMHTEIASNGEKIWLIVTTVFGVAAVSSAFGLDLMSGKSKSRK